MNMKKMFFAIMLILSCLSWTTEKKNNELKIAVLSDIHIMAPQLLQGDGDAIKNYIKRDRKLLQESVALLNQAIDSIIQEHPDVVLIPGDLTKDGEYVSHILTADTLLKRFRDEGIAVYVIPGNHDVNNPHAAIYYGDSASRTRTVSRGEFAEIYSDYGYGKALARDTASLTYVVQLTSDTRLLAIDACRYDENVYVKNRCVTGGRIKPATEEFIRRQAEDAKRNGCRMIAMMHHGLVRHWKWQDKVMGDYIVADWEKHAASMAKVGIRMVFTGHFHANDISEYVSWTDKIYDIETGSTVSYPMPYRMVTLHDGEASVDTRYVKHLPGIMSESELESKARQYASSSISAIVSGMLPKKVPATVRQEVANTLAKAYMAHLAGDERMPEDYPAELKRACKSLRRYSWKYAYALDKLGHYLYKDLGVDDNKVTIEW